jgi:GNAT superfamily N-acetyltransferase
MNKILESKITKHLPRFARVLEAAAVHAVLSAARDDIPITATDFNLDRYLEWARNECRQKSFLVIEIDRTIAGVMLLHDNDIFYLVTAKPYQRRGVATALLAYAKKRHRPLCYVNNSCRRHFQRRITEPWASRRTSLAQGSAHRHLHLSSAGSRR